MEDKDKNLCECGHDHSHEEDCGCGCGHDHDHEPHYMTLKLENDEEVRCIVIGTFEIDEYPDKEYIALVSEDGEESFVYQYVESDDEEGFELLNIESDDEFSDVVSAIDDILSDDEEWDEEDEEEYEFEDEE